MSSSLADRLSAARHSRFVGRTEELKLFESAIFPQRRDLTVLGTASPSEYANASPELPFHVLHIFGPGGVGKTTLLSEFTRICKQAQIPALYIDARNIEPAPESFLSALRFVMNLTPNDSPLEVLASRLGLPILLIDPYELRPPRADWLREVFLPELPANILVVLAGRHSPTSA